MNPASVRWCGVVLILLLLTGCSRQQRAARFNDGIAELNKKMGGKGRRFGEVVGEGARAGPGADPVVIDGAYDRLLRAAEQGHAGLKELSVPGDTLAQELYDAMEKYFREMVRLIKTDLREAATIAKGPGDATQKMAKIQPILQRYDATEQSLLMKAQEIQTRYARENRITLR